MKLIIHLFKLLFEYDIKSLLQLKNFNLNFSKPADTFIYDDDIDNENDCFKKENKNEKWLDELPNDIWFYILNEFFDKEYEQTHQLLQLSQVSKLFYNRLLLSSEIIMNNFTFSLKKGVKLIDIVNEIKPNYKIRNLSLSYARDEITNKDLKCLLNRNHFDLYQLDISFCNKINDESFQYFSNIKVLEMIGCNQNEITNEGLRKLNNIRELNMTACDQKTITNELFKSIR
jgi:hypothetical protein